MAMRRISGREQGAGIRSAAAVRVPRGRQAPREIQAPLGSAVPWELRE